jgi:hypothetical protein
LGVFISGFRDTTRGSAPICVCHGRVMSAPAVAGIDALLPSLIS